MSHYDKLREEDYEEEQRQANHEWEEFCRSVDSQSHSKPLYPDSSPTLQGDNVNSPKHYQFFPDMEAIEVIALSMTEEQFYGYCLGNRMKYRLRAGSKGNTLEDIAKSDKYLELYSEYKSYCIDNRMEVK